MRISKVKLAKSDAYRLTEYCSYMLLRWFQDKLSKDVMWSFRVATERVSIEAALCDLKSPDLILSSAPADGVTAKGKWCKGRRYRSHRGQVV